MFINNAMVFQLNNTTFKRKVTKENIILLNAFSSSYYDFIYPYDGSVTDMNIWGHSFGTKEIQEWSDCFNVTPGDFLSWEKAKFKFHGDIQTIEINQDEVCLKKNSNKYMAFNEKMNFIETVKFCEKIGGEIAVAEDFNTLKIIQDSLSDFRGQRLCTSTLYTGQLK